MKTTNAHWKPVARDWQKHKPPKHERWKRLLSWLRVHGKKGEIHGNKKRGRLDGR